VAGEIGGRGIEVQALRSVERKEGGGDLTRECRFRYRKGEGDNNGRFKGPREAAMNTSLPWTQRFSRESGETFTRPEGRDTGSAAGRGGRRTDA